MKLTVLFFGNLQDVVGDTRKVIESDSLSDVKALNEYLQSDYPLLVKQEYKIAVNQKIVEPTYNLANGDEVAFLPPFAGG